MALKYQEARYEVLGIFLDIPLLLNSLESAAVQLRFLRSTSNLGWL